MLDRITSMQIFVKVVHTGSFSAAGRAFHLSPTMVTKHINALEQRLNCTLLHRTTRKISLTEAGTLFYQGCDKILSDIDIIEQTITAQHINPKGHLKINAPLSLTLQHFSPLLIEFYKQYPDITIELGLNDRIVDLVEEGWDLSLRIGKMVSSTLKARKLAPIEFILCASADYLERHGKPTQIQELSEHQCLLYSLGTLMNRSYWRFGKNGEHNIHVHGSFTANNGEMLKNAAIMGQGIAYLPKFLLTQELADKQLIPLDLDHPTIQDAALYIMYPPSDYVPLKSRVMIDYLVEQFSKKAPWD
ncbi:DNA-binding transcriptional regulator [Commensalibacter communis]|uniref:LysR family transcriptional regulator n=1 Tax=Commensalibacter communis TaxID=2972786 RepID=UPI0022FF6FFC|nr:LysR family transcriptional regulator [Commensalibacter communis]CAI3958073.1 DNA-binding transcriptional regulator [Commensalibacter communis]CAI3958168.1 DNA-binding transcriptional regulator [Commensalibacter communis]